MPLAGAPIAVRAELGAGPGEREVDVEEDGPHHAARIATRSGGSAAPPMWYTSPVAYGILLLRIVVGLIFVAHGSQKLFGWFGGGGPAGTTAFLASLGYRAPARMAIVVGLSEVVGGLLLGFGFLLPLAALLISIVMLNAIATVVLPKGFIGGYEFELTLMAVALGVTATGPGRISIHRLIGWHSQLPGVAWASAALGSAIVVTLVTTTLGRGSADLDELPG